MSDTDTRNVQTPRLGLNQPDVGADIDVWGDLWNQNAATLDQALLVTGGAMTGPLALAVATAPTAPLGTNTTQLATTAFVEAAVAGSVAGVSSFNTRTGAVTLALADITGAGGAPLSEVPLASSALPLMDGAAAIGVGATWARADHVHPTDTTRAAVSALAGYLPLAGGVLTGQLGVGGAGINYTLLSSGYSFAFGWNGSINCYVDGLYQGDIAFTTYVAASLGNYLPLTGGALTGPLGVAAGATDQPLSVSVNQGNYCRLYSTVANVRSWASGTRNDGAYAITDITGGADRLIVDLSGNVTLPYGGVYAPALIATASGIMFANLATDLFELAWDAANTSPQLMVNGVFQGYLIRSAPVGGFIAETQQMIDGTGANAYLWWTAGGVAHWPLTASDRRLKENVKPASIDALDIICKLSVYEADARFIPGAPLLHWDCALIADEVGELIPRAYVQAKPGEPNDYDSIRDLPVIATLIRAMQQLTARVETLETRMA